MGAARDSSNPVRVRDEWAALAKRSARRIFPYQTLLAVKRAQAAVLTRSARGAFVSAPSTPAWLRYEDLDRLQRAYPPAPGVFYGYDPASLARRGRERAKTLLSLLDPPYSGRAVMELACGDGMACAALQDAGAVTTAVDLSPRMFDKRAKQAGVHFIEADVQQLPVSDSEFDLVFSYNSFEHFERPEDAFAEAIRTAKPGGLIYLYFGPLYFSAFGLHAGQSIRVPYCQLLFEREVLDGYVADHALREIPWETVNGWSLPRYRQLWDGASAQVVRTVYREIPDAHGAGLITSYPQCFRSKTDLFENLIVGTIETVFRKLA